MNRRGIRLLALAGGVATLLPAAAAGAVTPKLGTYAGTTSQGRPITFTVSNNASRCGQATPPCVRSLRFGLVERCSEGSTLDVVFRPVGAIHVRRSGTFSRRFGLSTEPPLNDRGTFTMTTFGNGTLSDTEFIDTVAGRVTCFSGRVTFSVRKR